jgi:hypothetical protein
MAMNIGQYQTVDNGDLNKTLKIIVAHNNAWDEDDIRFTSYFNTTYNEGVEPGEFNWAPGINSAEYRSIPWRSFQIFDQYLDDEMIDEASVPIAGTNLTTAVFEATTIENIAFSVKSGQTVQMLLLQTNSNIEVSLFLHSDILSNAEMLGQLALDIMTSAELVARIEDFLVI